MKLSNTKHKGFTIVELLMAVWVMSIILTAVAAMAFALGSAGDFVDETAEMQSRIRFTTMYIVELVRNCKMICRNGAGNVVFWRADDNGDNLINPAEIVSLEIDALSGDINLITFQPDLAHADVSVTPGIIKTGIYKSWLNSQGIAPTSITLIDNCNYVYFTTDVLPPFAKRLNIFFGVSEGCVDRDYQIVSVLRCNSDYMLADNGATFVADDDL
ncbi:MAG: prepilin-type N-terminal cleavage/methylation domain-containing protein [Sedimentisphaerales bacterium]|nr:prepilin-type N-terminal cleavage/methylation domain-containing protein [Sedimentisphaerales bacterium]